MIDVAAAYFGLLFVLFFFWIYGIVSFLLDLKNKIIPGIKQYRRGRKQLKEDTKEKQQQEDKERQLY